MDIADRNGSDFRFLLFSADLFRDAAISFGSFFSKTCVSRSSASLCSVTSADHFSFLSPISFIRLFEASIGPPFRPMFGPNKRTTAMFLMPRGRNIQALDLVEMPRTVDTRLRTCKAPGKERKMPSKSKAQSRLMHAAARDPEVAKRTGVPQSVAKEFVEADEGRSLKNLPEHKTGKK